MTDWRPPNKDIDKIGRPPKEGLLAQLVERRHVNLDAHSEFVILIVLNVKQTLGRVFVDIILLF